MHKQLKPFFTSFVILGMGLIVVWLLFTILWCLGHPGVFASNERAWAMLVLGISLLAVGWIGLILPPIKKV